MRGEQPMKEDLLKKSKEYAVHMGKLCGLPVSVIEPSERQILFCTAEKEAFFCAKCRCDRCNAVHPFLYGTSEAFRWGGKYTYYCPSGLAFIACAVLDDDYSLTGGLVAGPFLLGDAQDTLDGIADRDQRAAASALPALAASTVNDYTSLLCAVCTHISGVLNTQRQGVLLDQSRLLNSVYDAHALPDRNADLVYQIQYEKRLHDLILSQDKSGAQDTLNELLGYIYFASDFDLEQIRARVIELLVLLSRSSIDAGANIHQVFYSNTEYLRQINSMKTLEDLSAWLTGVLHYFINYTFDYPSIKHSDVVYKCIDYIKQNYDQKISLDDIAVHVSLSRSYLSKLFKDETGYSLFSYVNHVRIEKSKQLLLDDQISLVDIAGLCGFEDQSYFTKVFKKETGVSPKRFRDNPGASGRTPVPAAKRER